MSASDLPAKQLIDLALEAIGDSAPERLRPLLHPEVRIATERGEHVGVDAALAWAQKSYDHLDRRLVCERLEPLGEGLLGSGRVEYVWRASREVGDTTPIHLAIRIRDGLLAGLALHEDRDTARADLDS